jgi:hypothetical protein
MVKCSSASRADPPPSADQGACPASASRLDLPELCKLCRTYLKIGRHRSIYASGRDFGVTAGNHEREFDEYTIAGRIQRRI